MLLNNNLRINSQQELIKPDALINLLPANARIFNTIEVARQHARNIIRGIDNRLLIIVGPCSIHDTQAAFEYAEKLKKAATYFEDDLCVIMRVYFEKPRTTIGWKGLINDPFLDGSFDINHGLTLARKLLLDLNQLGMPAGTEFLDTIIPQYFSELVSWCAVGARTVESQTHRALASGLPMPIGFKNNTDGNVKVAIDAITVASHPHRFLSITKNGAPTIIPTQGNPHCHIILRGAQRPNYSKHHVEEVAKLLQLANLIPHLMVDCSHGNSMKDYQRQSTVIHDLTEQLKNGSPFICGVMLESNLIAGRQELHLKENLVYGQSITDGCVDWEVTLKHLEELAIASRSRKLRLHSNRQP